MRTRGYTLVATLITVVILLLLGMVVLSGGLGGTYSQNTGAKAREDGLGNNMPSYMKLKAVDTQCRSNVGQARQAVAIARLDNGDQLPASLDEVKLGEQFLQCPIGKEKYEYDAATGNVTCPHPGHEKY
jgi:hypothetical protein